MFGFKALHKSDNLKIFQKIILLTEQNVLFTQGPYS